MSTKKEAKVKKETIFDIDLLKISTEELRMLRHQFYARRTNASDETRVLCNKRIAELKKILLSRKEKEPKKVTKKVTKKVAQEAAQETISNAPDTDKPNA